MDYFVMVPKGVLILNAFLLVYHAMTTIFVHRISVRKVRKPVVLSMLITVAETSLNVIILNFAIGSNCALIINAYQ